VRRFVVDNARYWVSEYHVDGLRLDAVHGIFDFSAKHLLQEIAECVHELGGSLGRRVLVIGESDLNDPKLIRPIEQYGFGLDGQWSDDFHHAVHALLTEEKLGYYADFGAIDQLAASLREPFVFSGTRSTHRRRRHGGKSDGLPREKFVVAIQNHDQVGNRASGERLSTLLTPDQLRLAAALLLLSPYVPLIFMGEEYGETNPFQYFVSHSDSELVEAVRSGRRKEFEAFGWGEGVPDPQDEETMRRSVLDRERAAEPRHAAVFALYRDLVALRDEEPLLRPDGAMLTVGEANGCITILRTAHDERPGEALFAVFNCTADPTDVALPEAPRDGWSLRLTTDAPAYGGAGRLLDERQAEPDAWTDVGEPQRRVSGSLGIATADEPRRLLVAKPARTVSVPPWTAALYALSP
jgi:maltooligosyltrehalose trehalohydrolase